MKKEKSEKSEKSNVRGSNAGQGDRWPGALSSLWFFTIEKFFTVLALISTFFTI